MASTTPEEGSSGARKRDHTPPARVRQPEGTNGSEAGTNGVSQHSKQEKEFGGPLGAAFIMLASHVLIFSMAASLRGFTPALFAPTLKSFTWFFAYHGLQYALARTMPGVSLTGPSGLEYHCNGYASFYMTFAVAICAHVVGVFDLTDLANEFPSFLMTAVVIVNVYTLVLHGCYARAEQRFSIYDFFMGVEIHPRLGIVDIKMVAETRLSWNLLLLVTLGCYLETTRRLGTWWTPAAFMVLAHTIYANACAKGEHFIPYTWDITTERFGWMLCWWNLVGVPLLYCYQSLFLVKYAWHGLVLPSVPPIYYYSAITLALLVAYWVWDESNYQRLYFKLEQRNELVKRRLFPTFRHLKDPKYIKCDAGVLLVDGWYKTTRKIAYTADASMALLWGLACGVGSLLPYVYFVFFLVMMTHRCHRDEARCRQKYGATWDRYLKTVPWRFVPHVY